MNIQTSEKIDSFWSSSTAQEMSKVPFMQLRNFAKSMGLHIEFGCTKPQLIRQIVEATGFRIGDHIEVVQQFATDCDEPHILPIGMRLVIVNIDEDGDLAVNRPHAPWSENAWIMTESFSNIKIAERQAFVTHDEDFAHGIAVEVGHVRKENDEIERFMKPTKKKNVLRVQHGTGNIYWSSDDGFTENILMDIFEDSIIVVTVSDFLCGARILPTKTKMFDSIRIGLKNKENHR